MLGDFDNNKEVYLSQYATEVKYHRTNPIYNLTQPIFFTALTYGLLMILKMASFISRKASKYYFQNKQEMYWNYFIRLLLEGCIAISLSCMVKLYALDFSNLYESFSSIFALAMLLTVLLFPLIATRFLWKLHRNNYEVMLNENFT